MDAFRQFAKQMFLDNILSGSQLQELCAKATGAGAAGVEDLARAGASGACAGNAKRDLLRTMLRESGLPPLYFFKCPVKDPRKNTEVEVELPCLLPHELLWHLMTRAPAARRQEILDASHGFGKVRNLLDEWCAQFDLDPANVVPLGLHGDGVPFSVPASVTTTRRCVNKHARRSCKVCFVSLNCALHVCRKLRPR